jgi:hypothetical protein
MAKYLKVIKSGKGEREACELYCPVGLWTRVNPPSALEERLYSQSAVFQSGKPVFERLQHYPALHLQPAVDQTSTAVILVSSPRRGPRGHARAVNSAK